MARKKQTKEFEPNFKRPQLNLKKDTRKGVAVVFFVVLAILFTLSLAGSAGTFGQIANQVMKLAFGWMAYGVPLIFMMVAVALFRTKDEDEANTVSTHAYVGAVLLTLTLTGVLHLVVLRNNVDQAFDLVKQGIGGGYLGVLTSYPLMHLMGFTASLVILIAGVIISIFVTFNISFIPCCALLFALQAMTLLGLILMMGRVSNLILRYWRYLHRKSEIARACSSPTRITSANPCTIT